MNRFIEAVREFHDAYGCTSDFKITPHDAEEAFKLLDLRDSLILEEMDEFYKAAHELIGTVFMLPGDEELEKNCKVAMLDGITDLLYVVVGTAVAFGLDIETAFERIHASNMSKLGPDGKPIYREDGKVLKGPGFFPPKLDDLV